jgi:uncharacterized membrane protein
MAGENVKVLIVGESAFKIHTHFKGFASYETAYMSAGLDSFTNRFRKTPVSFEFMHNHDISLRFPFTTKAMRAYDVIVISDAPADSFLLHPDSLAGEVMPNRLALIGDYVRGGGGFAMIGGWMSFGGFHGKAHYAYSPLAGLLPIEMDRNDDRMETPEGVHPEPRDAKHPVLAGLDREWPDLLGYNRFKATGGETLLSFRETGDPALVVDTIGKGRVACFASDLQPHWGSPRFQAWRSYTPFWVNLMRWLARRI